MTIKERFWSKVHKSGADECWLWIGYQRRGYGWFTIGQKTLTAHRFSFYLHNGYYPESTDHLCRVKLCVNPSHLEGVTVAENTRRRPVKQFCPQGHPYSDLNTYRHTDSRGVARRLCKTCKAQHTAAWLRKKRTLLNSK